MSHTQLSLLFIVCGVIAIMLMVGAATWFGAARRAWEQPEEHPETLDDDLQPHPRQRHGSVDRGPVGRGR